MGHQCALKFRTAGWQVVATHCSLPTPTTVKYDCTKPESLNNFDVESFNPQLIIHCAADVNAERCERNPEKSHLINVQAVKHIAVLAKKLSAGLVYVSSDYVFDGSSGPYCEDDTPCPINVYGKHKLEAENYLLGTNLASTLKVLVLRVTNVYGEDAGRNINFVSRITSVAKNTIGCTTTDPTMLRLPADQYATPIDAADIATITEMLVLDGKSGLYHLASPEYLSRVQLARKVLHQAVGNNVEILPMKTTEMGQAAPRPLKGGLLTSRFQNEYPGFVFRQLPKMRASTTIAALAAAAVATTTNAFAPTAAVVRTPLSSAQSSSQLYAKGFGTPPPEPRGKSDGQVDREGKASKYDEIAATGGQEYRIFVRQFGSDDESWLPVGSIAVPRGAQVADAVFANTGGLETGIVRTYPNLKGMELEFEYGYNLKIYPDDPVQVAVKGGGTPDDFSFGGWMSNLLSPVDASGVPPPPMPKEE